MKKTILLCLFSWFTSCMDAQFHTSIDIVSSIDYAEFKGANIIPQDLNFSIFPIHITSKVNYRIGGNFNFRCYDKLLIKTGVRYVQIGFKQNLEGYILYGNNGNSTSPNDPYVIELICNSFDQKFIEVPLMARYEFGDGKFSLFIEFGISPHIRLSSTNIRRTKNGDEAIDDFVLNGDGRILTALVIGVGGNYNLSQNYQLFMQPTFRVYSASTNEFEIENRVRSMGLEFGIRRGISFSE